MQLQLMEPWEENCPLLGNFNKCAVKQVFFHVSFWKNTNWLLCLHLNIKKTFIIIYSFQFAYAKINPASKKKKTFSNTLPLVYYDI